MSRLTVVGAGYVGLVTAACMAELGHDIVAMDVDADKIQLLRDGGVPIYEPGLTELIAANRDRIEFTTDPAHAYRSGKFVFVCVDTPPLPSGDADLSRIWQAIDNIPADDGRHVLITKSTVPVGTGALVSAELAQRGHSHIDYASNPEFLREGTAIFDFMHADRVVVGADDSAVAAQVAELYQGLDSPVLLTDVASAEMIKYACNAFLATKISFINEIANVCEITGADVTVVAKGMGMDKRIGPHFLQAGIGYGGSCFPKDVSALKQIAGNYGYHFQLLNAVIEVNELQKRRVIGKLKRHLGDELRGKCVALLGLSFKPNTDDIRQASVDRAGRPPDGRGSARGRLRPAGHAGDEGDPTQDDVRLLGPRRGERRRCVRARDRMERVPRARLGAGQGGHGTPDRHRRAQCARPCRPLLARFHLRRHGYSSQAGVMPRERASASGCCRPCASPLSHRRLGARARGIGCSSASWVFSRCCAPTRCATPGR